MGDHGIKSRIYEGLKVCEEYREAEHRWCDVETREADGREAAEARWHASKVAFDNLARDESRGYEFVLKLLRDIVDWDGS